ncbi:MAG TPA: Maf family protein, partial [Nevskiaceae bacterium]|nr:Maf family protein [Nevskiaceae bacterium]
APRFADHWILGCDQVAAIDGRIFGKPGNAEGAIEQLRALSGRTVQFITAMALIRNDRVLRGADITTARFRALGDEEIRRYIAAEPAFDCAGSFKSEGLGITLFDEITSRDPTALIGLPLIALSKLLREAGYALP